MQPDLFWTIVGFVLGLLGQFFFNKTFWETQLVQSILLRRHQERLNEVLSKSRSDLIVGSLRIKQMMAQVFDPPLVLGDLTTRFEPQMRKLPSDLQELEFTYLPKRVSQLKSQGKTVDFNERYALKSIRIERPQLQDGERCNRPELVFEPTNFKYFLMTNDCLDDPLLPEPEGEPVSIRQRHDLELLDFQWADVEKMPLHQSFATVTSVITSDNQLVIPIRSEMQAITDLSGGDAWHRASLSCAEGMLRPIDSITPPPVETPDPFQTAFRSLSDELGLRYGEHYVKSDVKLLGIGYDKKRCQPLAIFYLELENLGFLDVRNCWETAKDRHEQMTLMPVAAEPKSIAKLLLGKLSYAGKPVRLFSNHQKLGGLLVGFHRLGVRPLTDALSSGR